MARKITYTCDNIKCGKTFENLKDGYRVGVDITDRDGWVHEEYHYCCENCFNERFSS